MAPAFFTYLRYSFAFRLVALYVALFMVSVSILVGGFYWMMVTQPWDETAEVVTRELDALSHTYKVDGEAALVAALDRRFRAPAERRAFHAFINENGKLVAANLPSWPSVPRLGFYEIEADRYLEGDEIDYQALSKEQVFANGARLIVGRDIEDVGDRQEQLIEGLVAAFVVSIILGGAGGVFMSLAAGKRIEAISAAARKVIDGDLSRRVPTTGSGDDFDNLANTLNEMLDRIERSVEAISRVSDSVAHELRLPLSRLHAELEDLASAAERGDMKPELAERAIAESVRLKAVFEALLSIARLETGRHSVPQENVDLTTVVSDAVELFQPEAEERGLPLKVTVAPNLMLQGDVNLLFQMVSNLLDNAIKFAPVKSTVEVEALMHGGVVSIAVTNEGPGIAPEHRARVTERFYRAGDGTSPGLGLGLSLVEAVAKAHGGKVLFRDRNNTFSVIIEFHTGA
ncbi:sensor histidine kinase [Kordiimonas gwangyangensis]|uniref:sensor histidine kinase n=1 Tax=Kordiimonas gwangyangensis TaxID=288022 RepID=UPI00037D22C4|nr:HAMP domain-containing sensor histidine kinase [Kordiimonas gwangyangensis]